MEVLLIEIRGKTISYASFKKKETNKLEDNLNTEINKLENRIDNIEFDLLDEKKRLENIRKKKIEGILIRSIAKWINEGEKINKYFCNLENRNFISKSMTKTVSHNGTVLTDTSDICMKAKTFYETLFASKEHLIPKYNLESIFATINKINKEDANSLDGEITYNELLNVLKNTKKNKSPGSDGFTYEFLKIFLERYWHIFTTINK